MDLGLSRNVRSQYNGLARAHGLGAIAPGPPRRLDWQSGLLMVEDDAQNVREDAAC